MKITNRYPTVQYGFVEIEQEVSADVTDEVVRAKHYEMLNFYSPTPTRTGLDQKQMTDYLYNALHGIKGPGNLEAWEAMSPEQQSFCRALRNGMERKHPDVKN